MKHVVEFKWEVISHSLPLNMVFDLPESREYDDILDAQKYASDQLSKWNDVEFDPWISASITPTV